MLARLMMVISLDFVPVKLDDVTLGCYTSATPADLIFNLSNNILNSFRLRSHWYHAE